MTTPSPLHIHLIAICGTGMGALAVMLKAQGHHVTGSDKDVYPPMSTVLSEQNIPVYKGFSVAHLAPQPDLVVIGNAVSRGNPEAEAVLSRKIRYASMPETLKTFFLWNKTSIVVTGTHGKTTTTSMLAWVMEQAGFDPSYIIGGIPIGWATGAKLGAGDIGQKFSNKSKKFKNIRSTILLKKVINEIKQKNYFINNLDINIITQTPKIKKYRNKMIDNISKLCKISKDQINIKGKTTEKLGVIGKEKAIACEVIASVIKYDQ